MEYQRDSQRKILACFRQIRIAAVIALVALLMYGCGSGSYFTAFESQPRNVATFVRQDTDLGYVTKVAVLPFENGTQDEFAPQRVRDLVMTQILSMGIFDVVDKGIVDSTLREMAIDKTMRINTPILKRLGQRLGVQAFIYGVVENIGANRTGAFSYPEVSLTMKLIDAETSMVLWQSSAHKNGYSLWDRLFGLDPQDGFQLTLDLTQEMLLTIPK